MPLGVFDLHDNDDDLTIFHEAISYYHIFEAISYYHIFIGLFLCMMNYLLRLIIKFGISRNSS